MKNNLQFFKEICQQLHIDTAMLADSVSPQAVSYMFCTDDAKLSTLQRRLRHCGYRLEPHFASPKGEQKWFEIKFNFNLSNNVVTKNKKDALLCRRAEEPGRIQFLAKYILTYRAKNNLTMGHFCSLVKVEYLAFRRILESQDCKISQLVKICQATGAVITWRVSKI